MQYENNSTPENMQATPPTRRGRVGFAVFGSDAKAAVDIIVEAEAAGVQQVWMTQSTPAPDTLGIFAAAAMRTTSIRMGTAIVPTYPRHPLALAQQALTLGDLAPQRLRLGVGPSHRPVIEGAYGLTMSSPLAHLREYVEILRAALWEGHISHHGQFFHVESTFPRTPHTPILISALREGAFHLAGEISDGAISWMCPVPYLLTKARPALQAGAAQRGRPTPPLIAHIPVALSQDRQAVLAAARQQVGRYSRLPFYASMFADAGFPIPSDGTMPDDLIDNLVIFGDTATITTRLTELLASGLDELLVMLVSIADPTNERSQLIHLIGQL